MNLEINFYLLQDGFDFKSNELKEMLKQITQQIFINNFSNNEYFDFYLTKKTKTTEEMLQTENV
jgi:hypothetical protein